MRWLFMKLVLAIVQDDDALDLIEELNNIKSKYGKYAIIGNHDHVKDINLLKDIYMPFPLEVEVGGATVFVIDVDKFVKI